MNLSSVIDRLGTIDEFSGRVAIAADMKESIAILSPMASPSCVLFAPRETGGKQELMAGGYRQRVAVVFGVLVCFRYAGDMGHGGAYAALDDLRQNKVLHAMLGFIPDGADSGCTLVNGRLAYSEPGMLIWLDEFTASYTLSRL